MFQTSKLNIRPLIKKGSNIKKYKTDPEIVKDLPEKDNSLGDKTSLHYQTDPEIVKDLLERGIDPNIRDENGNTALEVTGNFKIAKILLEYGAKVDSKEQMAKILYQCAHNQKENKEEKKITLSLLIHNNTKTEATKANLIKQLKETSDSSKIIFDYINKTSNIDLISTCEEYALKNYYVNTIGLTEEFFISYS